MGCMRRHYCSLYSRSQTEVTTISNGEASSSSASYLPPSQDFQEETDLVSP